MAKSHDQKSDETSNAFEVRKSDEISSKIGRNGAYKNRSNRSNRSNLMKLVKKSAEWR